MKIKPIYIISLICTIILFTSNFIFNLFLKFFPFIISLFPLLYLFRKKNQKKLESESIFEKRIKRFKTIKRGYYSLIILTVFYVISLISPLWMNNKPIMLAFKNGKYDQGESFYDTDAKNGKYDQGESFTDKIIFNNQYDSWDYFSDFNQNGEWDYEEPFDDRGNGIWDKGEEFIDANIYNGKYDQGESFTDRTKYYFPAIRDFFDFIPGISSPFYEAEVFNQNISGISANFRLLKKQIKESNSDNYIVMPLYVYHPHEDLKDELDEEFNDINNNGKWDPGEAFSDDNNDGKWTENNPPTLPSKKHIAGTDNTGRDVFARLVDGYKISMTFAVIVTTLSYIIGVIIGACLGYYGGKLDLFGLRLIEIFSSIPFLFMLMILGSFMKPGVFLLALLSVLLKGWIGITWYIRGEFFREKPKDYVSAAVSMGQSNWKIMFKHILPNSLTPIITFAPFSIIGDIGTLVALDFLGYGLKPPASSWGNLLQQGAENLDYWHMLIFPVVALTLTIFMITFISEAVREAFDPKVYSRLR